MSFIPTVFGFKEDKEDTRDLRYSFKATLIENYKEVKEVSLEQWCPQIEQQLDIGSCTANAVVEAFEFLQNKKTGKFLDASRLFLYYNTRVLENSTEIDSGASLRDTIKAFARYGVVPESKWGYTHENLFQKPPEELYQEALGNRIRNYMRADCSKFSFVSRMMEGFPLVFGIALYDSFLKDEVSSTGLVRYPTKNENKLGGHAMLAVGHADFGSPTYIKIADQYTKTYKTLSNLCPVGFTRVLNHWGEEWGDHGKCWIPDDYIFSRKFTSDIWTVFE